MLCVFNISQPSGSLPSLVMLLFTLVAFVAQALVKRVITHFGVHLLDNSISKIICCLALSEALTV